MEPVFSILRIAAPLFPEPPPFDQEAALRQCNADQTRAPEIDEQGFVECVHCSAFVPYASMSLNEDGCFCRLCAQRLTSNAVADLPPEAYKL